jgi:hypothetical protein
MHSFRLHWLLLDVPFETGPGQTSIELQTSVGQYRVAMLASAESRFEVVRAAADSPRGWCSPYYHSREPAISISLQAEASIIQFATVLGPEARPPILADNKVQVCGPHWRITASLDLKNRDGAPLVNGIESEGSLVGQAQATEDFCERPLAESYQCTSC